MIQINNQVHQMNTLYSSWSPKSKASSLLQFINVQLEYVIMFYDENIEMFSKS